MLEYSSFGILEDHIQREYAIGGYGEKIEVLDIWKASDCINTGVLSYAFIFRDKLRLSAGFNGGSYEQSFIQKILKDVIVDLFLGLGIEK